MSTIKVQRLENIATLEEYIREAVALGSVLDKSLELEKVDLIMSKDISQRLLSVLQKIDAFEFQIAIRSINL